MDFSPSPLAQDYLARMSEFMDEFVYPAEEAYEAYRRAKGPDDHTLPPVVEELKAEARKRGLWNLFLPDAEDPAHGLRVIDYAPIAELTGRSPHIAPEAINCAAPDTGNMEVLHLFGTPEQKQRWLRPLLEGQIRSSFAMTEPDVASSDATNIQTRIERDGDDYVLNGRKWWISGAADPRCPGLHRDGQDRPDRAAAPAAVDDPGAAGHPGPGDRARPARLRLQRPGGSLRAALHRRAGAGDQPHRR